MNNEDYKKAVLKTEAPIAPDKEINVRLLYHSLELFHHAAMVLEYVKKNVFYNKPLDAKNMEDYMAVIKNQCNLLQVELDCPDALSTISRDIDMRLVHGIMGMGTEAGELTNALITVLNDGEMCSPELRNIKEELGDSEWYKVQVLDCLNITEEEIHEANIKKLRSRYKTGKFTESEAITRNVEQEYSDAGF